jgi:hypothetical protein
MKLDTVIEQDFIPLRPEMSTWSKCFRHGVSKSNRNLFPVTDSTRRNFVGVIVTGPYSEP